MLDAQPERLDGSAQTIATSPVQRLLRDHVGVVVERGAHGRLHGGRHDHARVLAGIHEPGDDLGVAGHEGRAVAREVRLLGQRVDGQQPREVSPGHARIQHGGHSLAALLAIPLAPAQLGIALVRGHDRAQLASPLHRGAHGLDVGDRTRGIARRVQPDQADPLQHVLRQLVQVLCGHVLRTGQLRPDVVGGVGGRGTHHDVPGAQPQQQGQPGHELLGADRGHDLLGVQSGHAATAVVPAGDGLAQRGGAVGGRVAGGVGGRGQRVLDHQRRGVHGRADRQIDGPLRVLGGDPPVRGHRLPGVLRQIQAEGAGLLSHGTQSWFCGGRAAMPGWSLPVLPRRAAPPGEPRSSKNSTLYL